MIFKNRSKNYLPSLIASYMLTDYQEAIIEYIAGFVVWSIVKKISCDVCGSALQEQKSSLCASDAAPMQFISCINRGGLIVPTKSVVQIVQTAEKAFDCLLLVLSQRSQRYQESRLFNLLTASVNRHLSTVQLFESLIQHDIDHALIMEDLHSTQLQKSIVNRYLLLRAQTYGRHYRKSVIQHKKEGVRQQHNILVLFNNV